MNGRQEVVANGHLQVIGGRGNRRWRAFWWDADGKHSRVLGPAWAQNSGKKTARGAIVWHAADGPKPDPSYLTPKEARAELRRLLEHDVAKRATPRAASGQPMTFADAAEAWLRHGERKRNLKRSTHQRLPPDTRRVPPPRARGCRRKPDTVTAARRSPPRALRDVRSDAGQGVV